MIEHKLLTAKFIARFWRHVNKTDTCWLWLKSVDDCGYGYVWFDGKMQRAHRVGFMFQYDTFDTQLNVLHKCDNPPCVRGDHLFQGTQSTNAIDASKKGRHPWLKLSEQQVLEAKALYDKGNITLSALARQYNCNKGYFAEIFTGKKRSYIFFNRNKENE